MIALNTSDNDSLVEDDKTGENMINGLFLFVYLRLPKQYLPKICPLFPIMFCLGQLIIEMLKRKDLFKLK